MWWTYGSHRIDYKYDAVKLCHGPVNNTAIKYDIKGRIRKSVPLINPYLNSTEYDLSFWWSIYIQKLNTSLKVYIKKAAWS